MISAWLAKYAAELLLGLVAVGIGVVLFFAWRHSANDATTATVKATAVQTQQHATQATAVQATSIVAQTAQKEQKTDEKTHTTVQNFYNTYPQAAKTPVDPALFAAFRASICLYVSAASLPECRAMQQLHSEGVPGNDQ